MLSWYITVHRYANLFDFPYLIMYKMILEGPWQFISKLSCPWFLILTHLVQNLYNYSYISTYIDTSYYVDSILNKIYWLLYVVAWHITMNLHVFDCACNHSCVETTSVNSPFHAWINIQGNCSIIQLDYPYLVNPINKRTHSLWFETTVVYKQWYMVSSRMSY